jgi:hypothetical protein
MTADGSSRDHTGASLTELRLDLYHNGYRPVPVSSHDLGIRSAGKRPLMDDWNTICATADENEIRRWTREQRNCNNTGLLCGDIVGIDIDVPAEALSNRIEALAREVLGSTFLKRIGLAPKRLLVFAASDPFEKIQTPELFLPDGTKLCVEVLATGQQFVGFGTHPDTKADYTWPGKSPLEVPAAELPVISRDMCVDFIRQAERLLRAAGGETKSERRKTDQEGRRAAGLGRDEKPSREIVAEALTFIPNDDLSYDEWTRVGFALYAALGAAGGDLWESWSAQSSKNSADFTAKKWPSFAGVSSITVGTLFWLAQQTGWRKSRSHQHANAGKEPGSEARTRPTIRIVAGELPQVVNEAEDALIGANLGLYQRGGLIVRPATTPVANADGRKTLAQRLVHVRTHHIAEAMTEAAVWERFDPRAGGWRRTDCTLRIAETYLSRDGLWRLPVLTAVINGPTLRADGSILDQPGYDVGTGLLFDPQGAAFPPVPQNPSKEDAAAALSVINSLIKTFPFVGKPDQAVALSGVLTTVIRRSLSTAPLHGYNAPAAGTGKSLLVDIASIIATGQPAAVIAQGKTEEEMEKRLGAALIAGDQLISIDNCEGSLGGELLCQALTQPSLKIRILGRSLNAEVPSNAAMFATGNNLTLVGDMTRRAIRCSLDAGVERPELRAFESDPIETVRAKRGEYLVAVLTVLRAFHLAGRPRQAPPLGSFAEWSWVRDALIWLGEADPCVTMDEVRNADPKLDALTMVIEQWQQIVGDRRVSAKQIIDTAVEQDGDHFGRSSFVNPDFREALLVIAGDRGAVSGRRLGKWLAANQNRVIGGRKIVADGIVAGILRWRLASVDAPSGWQATV